MHAVAMLTLALAGAPQTAVVDLSSPPAPPLAEALRALPELKGRSLSAQATHLIVADAASLGLSCAFGDDACLQKLVVLARVEELIAVEATPEEVRLARVSARAVQRASARVAGSPAARARAAWGALHRLEDGPRVALPSNDQPDEVAPPDTAATPESPRPADDVTETPTASSGGVTPPLVVGMAGAGATLLLGAGAVGVSAALAQQLRGTQRGIPLDDSYDTLQIAFWSLSALTVAAATTSAVGLGIFLSEAPEAVTAP